MTEPELVAGGTAGDVERVQALLEAFHVAARTALSHGPQHPLARQNADALRDRFSDAGVPFTLQFIGKAFFKDRNLIPLSPRVYRLARHLAQAFQAANVHEVTAERVPDSEPLLALASALGDIEMGRRASLDQVDVPGLSWREIPWARFGVEIEDVDPEVFSAAQVALAIADAQSIPSDRTACWSYARGMAVVRRLERAVRTSREGVARALEMVPGQWTVARRAVAACVHVLTVLSVLKVSAATRRVVAHAELALACTGLAPRGGSPFPAVAPQAFLRLLDAPAMTRTGVEPHRAKVCALVLMAASPDETRDRAAPALDLLTLAYELELRRCPQDTAFDLTLADLLADAVSRTSSKLQPAWISALATAYGEIPPGARVLLPDGRTGIVLGAGQGPPHRPDVLVGRTVVTPDGPVRFITPKAAAAAGGA